MSDREAIIPAAMRASYENFHFAPAVRDGEWIYASGQTGNGPDGKVDPDPEKQFTQAFENVAAVLAEAGASFGDVIEMTTFHVGFNQHIGAFMQVKDRYAKEPYPAWTAIGVSELAFGALVEVKVVARRAR